MRFDQISFRPATIQDADLLFEWRNDPETRKNSVSESQVTYPEHQAWLTKTLQNPDKKLYIAELERNLVGTVRLEKRTADQWELSWTVSPEMRGFGIGKWMVKKATELTEKDLIAKIKSENTASMEIAKFAGFEVVNAKAPLTEWNLRRVRR